MINISESTINILVGGALASIFPLANLFVNNYRLKKKNKLRYLEKKKQELKESYKKSLELLDDSMQKDAFDADLVTDYLVLYPKNVTLAFMRMMVEKNKRKLKDHSFKITEEMKKSLSDIDEEIKKEL